jgi:hypothetical protein
MKKLYYFIAGAVIMLAIAAAPPLSKYTGIFIGHGALVTNTYPLRLGFDGASLICSNSVVSNNWPLFLMSNYCKTIGNTITVFTNSAIEGKQTTVMLSQYPTRLGAFKPAAGERGILFLGGGAAINDNFAGVAATDTRDNLAQIAVLAHADGWTKVFVTADNYDFLFNATQSNTWYTLNGLLRATNAFDGVMANDSLVRIRGQTLDGVHSANETIDAEAAEAMRMILNIPASATLFSRKAYIDSTRTAEIVAWNDLNVISSNRNIYFGSDVAFAKDVLTLQGVNGVDPDPAIHIWQSGIYGENIEMIMGPGQVLFENNTRVNSLASVINTTHRIGGVIGSVVNTFTEMNDGSVDFPVGVSLNGVAVPTILKSFLAANATSTSATLANSALSVTVVSGHKYSFKAELFLSDSTAADGAKIDFGGGSATATDFRAQVTAFDTALNLSTQVTSLTGAASASTFTGAGAFEVHGSFEPSSSGTFIVRFAQAAHTLGTLTLARGSHLTLIDN